MESSDSEESVQRKKSVRPVFARKKKPKKEVVFYTSFEEVLEKINPFGPYQIFTAIVILYASIEWAGNSTFMYVLGTLEPTWNCTHADGKTYEFIPSANNDSTCNYIKQNCANLTAVTSGPNATEFYSLVAAFKLICDDSDKTKWIEVIMAGGSLIGSIVGGHMGDHLGRKRIFLSGQILIILTSMMCTASRGWIAFAVIQAVNCFLYGVIETTSLAMMMEYTNNKYRVVMANTFQWPFAYMTLALIAFLTKVLNDIAHQRWNNRHVRFTEKDISSIHKKEKYTFYWFYHLFRCNRKLAKQSLIQILSMFTYAMVSNTYLYTVSGMHVVEAIVFGVIIALLATNTYNYDDKLITILIIIATMINDSFFYINILQITAQRYPTVIRCIAFGCLHSTKHIGAIVGYLILRPLLTSSWPLGAFVFPEALIVVTLIVGLLFQPETKGKVWLAAGHKVAQNQIRQQYRKDAEEAQNATRMGIEVQSPWVYKSDSRPASRREPNRLMSQESRGYDPRTNYNSGAYQNPAYSDVAGGSPVSSNEEFRM
ncbi:hypothetical protein WR25_07046 [Diploscapter pachys]|uniref:Major facilitator superfamily (MFS) profile domain-containing protein n=1 Tax=Diploscapter pachys TaxID=2018661 RepID=A0A2A2JS42_9BILA|nr:hypothetical protein WR25_07046 [Diploscapter pachys]